MTKKILKRLSWTIIIAFVFQAYILLATEQRFLIREHGIAYAYEPTYYSEEYGELKFKSSLEGGYFIWQEYEKEFYTETGGYITLKYAMILGIYIDFTDEKMNQKTAKLQ